MSVLIEKACKTRSKLRLAIFGISGSGKTKSALRIASGMGKKIVVIDTENYTSNRYADEFDFDVANLKNPTIPNYIEHIDACKDYDVIIIDSLTHCWQELLQEINMLEKTKYKNSFGAWSEGTPKQKSLIKTIIQCNTHIIATMRQKTEWTLTRTEKGLMPSRHGLAPEQGKGIEYEFDLLMQLTSDHVATIIKDRTGKYQDEIIEKPGEDFGKELMAWLNDGMSAEKLLALSVDKIKNASGLIELRNIFINSKQQLKLYDNKRILDNLVSAKDQRKEFLLSQTLHETEENIVGEKHA